MDIKNNRKELKKMKKYLMSQYGMYIEKITDKRQWLTVTLIDDLRKDKEKICKYSK